MDSKGVPFEEIIEFVRSELAVKSALSTKTTLVDDLGCDGDDFDEFIIAYSTTFKVNIDEYLWYFHHYEEGINLGELFFKPPSSRVVHIPVTLKMLGEFANTRKWEIDYPNHYIPRYRYDILTNRMMFAAFLLLLAYFMAARILPYATRFFEQDKCLDRGGRWNYEVCECEYSEKAANDN